MIAPPLPPCYPGVVSLPRLHCIPSSEIPGTVEENRLIYSFGSWRQGWRQASRGGLIPMRLQRCTEWLRQFGKCLWQRLKSCGGVSVTVCKSRSLRHSPAVVQCNPWDPPHDGQWCLVPGSCCSCIQPRYEGGKWVTKSCPLIWVLRWRREPGAVVSPLLLLRSLITVQTGNIRRRALQNNFFK